jgi:hypothetical protein
MGIDAGLDLELGANEVHVVPTQRMELRAGRRAVRTSDSEA